MICLNPSSYIQSNYFDNIINLCTIADELILDYIDSLQDQKLYGYILKLFTIFVQETNI